MTMPDSRAARLAERFADDARALRVRAEMLRRQPKSGGGPDAAACEAMATACDRVHALFAAASDDAALADVGRQLAGLRDAERSRDAQHVYAGAAERLRQSLDATHGHDENDDEDDEDDDLEDDED